jgi:hypothetical protein
MPLTCFAFFVLKISSTWQVCRKSCLSEQALSNLKVILDKCFLTDNNFELFYFLDKGNSSVLARIVLFSLI